MNASNGNRRSQPSRPIAIILGLDEIASAIAVRIHEAGYSVVMSHDTARPVIRRGMAFFDALYDDPIVLGGLPGIAVHNTLAARAKVQSRKGITVTRLSLSELLVIGNVDTLIDARMRDDTAMPDLRHLARLTIGLGQAYAEGDNCDVAIDARLQAAAGEPGAQAAPYSCPQSVVGERRFLCAGEAGTWRTPLDVGKLIFKGFPLGCLGSRLVHAPIDGVLIGIARDGIDVPAGAKLIEIEPRARRAQWTGIDARGQHLAELTCEALRQASAADAPARAQPLRLVHSR